MVDALETFNAIGKHYLSSLPVPASPSSRSVVARKTRHLTDDCASRRSLGSRDEGLRWLGTPALGLDFATPISLLATPEGVERVNDILGQIEHGVW